MRRLRLSRYSNGRLLLLTLVTLLAVAYGCLLIGSAIEHFMTPDPRLLSDPFLQLPTASSVRVVWFTEFEGRQHQVEVGQQELGQQERQPVLAATTKLSRVREDQDSHVGQGQQQQTVARNIWRHEAEVSGLAAETRLPYRVTSVREDGRSISSKFFTLAALPQPQTPQKILLTSDHQLMPMTPANLQKVMETIGQPDAVFMAGDLVNVGDRASEWFDDDRGRAFFPNLQGRATSELEKNGVKTRYRGGEIIQHAPLFAAVGNHEVMGRFSTTTKLNDQFGDAYPRQEAAAQYRQIASQINPTHDPAVQENWIKNHSFNTDTFQEIFSLPGYPYYAVTYGDIRLIVLYATNIWRTPDLTDAKGRYRERAEDLEHPENWGYGQHIFEPIAEGSPQYNWLQAELKRPEFQQAKYKIVMFHHPPHSLGDNIVPAYTNPVQSIDRHPNGRVAAVRYEYPIDEDYLIRDVVPLLEAAGVQLVYYGHSHLWNRFISKGGTHFLESSNVGNSYGAFWDDQRRNVPKGYREKYVALGDPNGLEPIVPLSPLTNEKNQLQPYIASNDISVFSIFDTQTGIVSSYRFDTTEPRSAVVKFDEFSLLGK